MKNKTIEVRILMAYGGNKPKVEVYSEGVRIGIMEKEYAEQVLAEAMRARGYELTKTGQQKIGRIVINEYEPK